MAQPQRLPANHCVCSIISSEASELVGGKRSGAPQPRVDAGSPGPFSSSSGGSGDAWPGTLLPELAQLQWLEHMDQELPALRDGIPAEWGAPGAFPRLRR